MEPTHAREEALRLAIEERNRQVAEEGFTSKDDDYTGVDEGLAVAAGLYILPNVYRDFEMRMGAEGDLDGSGPLEAKLVPEPTPIGWPWGKEWWKPTPENRLRELTKGVALALAEMERLLRGREVDESSVD